MPEAAAEVIRALVAEAARSSAWAQRSLQEKHGIAEAWREHDEHGYYTRVPRDLPCTPTDCPMASEIMEKCGYLFPAQPKAEYEFDDAT